MSDFIIGATRLRLPLRKLTDRSCNHSARTFRRVRSLQQRAFLEGLNLIRLNGRGMSMSYKRFAAMIATSTVVMFLLIYLNTYALEHVLFSETRLSMAILMGAAMAVVMLGFMLAMSPDKRANAGIFAGGAAGRGDLYEIEASELAVDRSEEHTSELQSLM